MNALSPRLLAALGVASRDLLRRPDGTVLAQVDDVDRRFRDAIKAGARGVHPPLEDPHLGRCAEVLDESGPAPVRVVLLADRRHARPGTLGAVR